MTGRDAPFHPDDAVAPYPLAPGGGVRPGRQAPGRGPSLGGGDPGRPAPAPRWRDGSRVEYWPDGSPIRYWPDGHEVSPETEALLDRIAATARAAIVSTTPGRTFS